MYVLTNLFLGIYAVYGKTLNEVEQNVAMLTYLGEKNLILNPIFFKKYINKLFWVNFYKNDDWLLQIPTVCNDPPGLNL